MNLYQTILQLLSKKDFADADEDKEESTNNQTLSSEFGNTLRACNTGAQDADTDSDSEET